MISVCMATYNGEKYLREQIDSILCQLNDTDELIVSDDGSSDDTLFICASYNDARIKIYNNHIRHGVVANFENALAKVKGEYVFLCDQDDVWLPNKVEKCIEALEYSDLVVTDCFVTDQFLNIVSNSFFEMRRSSRGFWRNLYKNTYLGACVAFRASALDIVLPFPPKLPMYHDAWIASLVDIKGRVVFLDYQAIYFRRHSNNTSFTANKSSFSKFTQIKQRVIFLYLIMKRLLCNYKK